MEAGRHFGILVNLTFFFKMLLVLMIYGKWFEPRSISCLSSVIILLLLVTDIPITLAVWSSSAPIEELSSNDGIYASGLGLDWSLLS